MGSRGLHDLSRSARCAAACDPALSIFRARDDDASYGFVLAILCKQAHAWGINTLGELDFDGQRAVLGGVEIKGIAAGIPGSPT
ncbi:hypothetical protein [Paeniglutamicibacter antarcticus]|uniref:Uncharacterized protein n=1 Tax=Paeniglutamicibacter antarcticus TaxID=494023 RepID=A0ABP9TQD9_9MICC